MANMSASILRNLVSSIFNVKATSVVLSGEINPEFSPEFSESSDYTNNESFDEVWGFDPQQGFVPIAVLHSTFRAKYKNQGDFSPYRHFAPLSTFKNVDKFIFFVVNSTGSRWVNTWDKDYDWDSWTLYKAPDFKSHWAKIEKEDIARWGQWLSE